MIRVRRFATEILKHTAVLPISILYILSLLIKYGTSQGRRKLVKSGTAIVSIVMKTSAAQPPNQP